MAESPDQWKSDFMKLLKRSLAFVLYGIQMMRIHLDQMSNASKSHASMAFCSFKLHVDHTELALDNTNYSKHWAIEHREKYVSNQWNGIFFFTSNRFWTMKWNVYCIPDFVHANSFEA